MRPVRTTSSATSTFFGILPSFSFSLRLSILQSQSGISFGSAFFLPVPVPALLLHFHAKNFIKGCPIPSERPRQSGQRHSQQKNQRIHSSRHMQVIPKPLPAFRARYLQTIFQCLTCTRPPDNDSGNQDYDKHQSADAYNHLSPENPLTSRIHTIQQPAVHPKHKRKETAALILSGNLARILIDIHRRTAGFGKTHLISAFRIRGNADTRHRNIIGQRGSHLFQQLINR